MPLAPGDRLQHYELIDAIGAGGMGEVWRARDTTLDREVAIKVLPQTFATDAERRARFENEARSLAALTHPHIAAIYGLHLDAETAFLAMELVPGQSLEERMARGPVPVDEALACGGQIAQALEAAHDRGIVHRDLKPGNVMLTPDGTVKVLDFGLAKIQAVETAGSDPSLSPTITSLGTQAGMILGTPAYMSPEQARGLPVDRRADVWALGVVLYEMLAGRRLFGGDTVSDTLAAVLRAEIDFDGLPENTPAAARRVLQRFLERDPGRRLRDAGELRFVAEEYAAHGDVEADAGPTQPAKSSRLRAFLVPLALLLGLLAGGFAGLNFFKREAAELPLSWLTIPPAAADSSPDGNSLQLAYDGQRIQLSLSPDGRHVTYTARSGTDRMLVRRSLDKPGHEIIQDTERATAHFYSPDGRSIVFEQDQRMVLTTTAGGAGREVCKPCSAEYGGTWAGDTLVLASGWASPLMSVPVAGGVPESLTALDRERGDISHLFPVALPGGGDVLFSIWAANIEDRMAAVVNLSDRTVKIVARAGNFYRYADGHLLFERGGTLYAQPFDTNALEVSGSPLPIASDVARVSADSFASFAVSQTGVLVFQRGRDGEQIEALWADRSGNVTPALAQPENLINPALSPDGSLLAAAIPVENSGYQINVFDLEGSTRTAVTGGGDNLIPLFSPDGRRVFFVSSLFDDYVIAEASVDGSTPPRAAVQTRNYAGPSDWSPDGKLLVYDRINDEGNHDVWITDLESPPRAVARTAAVESGVTFSPDGKWLAYTSNATGDRQLYLVPADGNGAARQVTRDGIDAARWNPAGGEILIARLESIWSLPVATQPSLKVGTAVKLFDMPGMKRAVDFRAEFDIAPDGRILLLRFAELDLKRVQIHVIQNLPELLRQRAAAL